MAFAKYEVALYQQGQSGDDPIAPQERDRNTVAVRLEGGVGDHLLGMRLLYFIRRRYPDHKILIYSDSGGNAAQLEVAAMSPYVAEVIPIFQDKSQVTMANVGALNNIEDQYLAQMRRAEVFVDGWPGVVGDCIYLDQSRHIDVPYYKILAARPRLKIPIEATNRATHLIGESPDAQYVAINLAKYGTERLRRSFPNLRAFLLSLLEDPRVCILNIFTRTFDFPYWPEAERVRLRAEVEEQGEALAEMCEWSERIIPIVDEKIPTIAALLKGCSFFIGVDNGIKHLAWALGVPRRFIIPFVPTKEFILRWIPDLNRLLVVKDGEIVAEPLLREVRTALDRGTRRLEDRRRDRRTTTHPHSNGRWSKANGR